MGVDGYGLDVRFNGRFWLSWGVDEPIVQVLILYRVVASMLNRAFGTQQPILGQRGLFMDGRALCAACMLKWL